MNDQLKQLLASLKYSLHSLRDESIEGSSNVKFGIVTGFIDCMYMSQVIGLDESFRLHDLALNAFIYSGRAA